ncbi:uncharacterized protein TrAtP1_003365 [Trichoderma atroviride]|uniref:uncharacterized protein n=1 Tax=Hypocrea atroviridis TaxID=63577 RepID=UPI003319333A|nr:hypothetical protein TrAtP1_003365 [Trichoderma atroviride]
MQMQCTGTGTARDLALAQSDGAIQPIAHAQRAFLDHFWRWQQPMSARQPRLPRQPPQGNREATVTGAGASATQPKPKIFSAPK